MRNEEILKEVEQYVRQRYSDEPSGHDWWHIARVVQTSRHLATVEGADLFICQLSAMLHDVADEKICSDPVSASLEYQALLKKLGVSLEVRSRIVEIIETISFKGGNQPPVRTLEAQVVQDADRLDAIGAIGIARVFAYSGAKSRVIHDPEMGPRSQLDYEQYRNSKGTAIMHFHEKLLKLKELMNTNYARQLAEQRHQFMIDYLDQFMKEWEIK